MDELQFIYGTRAQHETSTKEVKVRLSVRHLIRLHGLKLLAGQNISDTVDRALTFYFERVDAERAARVAGSDPVAAEASG